MDSVNRDKLSNIKGFILTAAIGIFVGVLLQMFVQICIVEGQSMNPTLNSGEMFVALKTKWTGLERGDVVAVNSKTLTYVDSDNIVKRIIGVPGDAISITDGKVSINGELLEEDYIIDKDDERIMVDTMEFQLGDDEYFVMGDNRNHSADSRIIGPIKSEYITSKYVFSFWGF